ncbi:MAG: Shikimate dehydrogenase [Desulfofundulus kuznetsovii]|nr:MAG: Shikimate dehydrogenase [Desulfotomaculum sp. 46_80]KUK85372.1 MAG: Shikimate dehydrogenase [Desulfofundulus kuznetsovii]
MLISGATHVCGIFGYPVEHSFSPVMHNAAFSFLGLDFVYVPYCVAPEELENAAKAVISLGIAGVNITIPHKEKVCRYIDQLTPGAKIAGAVNTIVNKKGKLYGHNTDGAGLLRSLKEEADFLPAGKTVLILGAGGAARSIAVELAMSGALLITIANRKPERAVELAHLLTGQTPVKKADTVHWTTPEFKESVKRADLIIQATPLGMYPNAETCLDFPFEYLQPGQVICDLVYNPPITKFLKNASLTEGVKVTNGIGMLLYQGVLAFEHWTGVQAPVEIMLKSLQEFLAAQVY